jgi:hypothetical protein
MLHGLRKDAHLRRERNEDRHPSQVFLTGQINLCVCSQWNITRISLSHDSTRLNYGHGVATLTPTNVYLCPLLLVNLNVNFPVAGSSVPEKVPSSVFPPIMS